MHRPSNQILQKYICCIEFATSNPSRVACFVGGVKDNNYIIQHFASNRIKHFSLSFCYHQSSVYVVVSEVLNLVKLL